MGTATKKKEALLTKKERLLKELEELDNTIEGVLEEEWKEQGDLIMSNIDSLIELVPTHSDGSVDEGHDDPNCLKCVLLAAKMTGKWLYKEYGLDISLVNKEAVKEAPKKEVTKPTRTKKPVGRPPKKKKEKLSENQLKAKELGLLDNSGEPKKLKRVLEVDESTVDLPDNWGV